MAVPCITDVWTTLTGTCMHEHPSVNKLHAPNCSLCLTSTMPGNVGSQSSSRLAFGCFSSPTNIPTHYSNKLEVFIEHIPRAERQARMHAVQLQSTWHLCRCASNRAAIAYTVFVYGHIQGVGVTAYRIYYIVKLAGPRGGAKCYE